MKSNNFLLSFIFILSLFTQIQCQQTTSDHAITVFIHGTFSFRKMVQYSPFRSLIYTQPGLHLATELPTNYHFHEMAQGFVDNNPTLYSLDQFYIFGWKSEHIYHTTRMQAAADLVTALQKLATMYHRQHGVIPTIRLIGFSHGGNVVLNTANYLPLLIVGQQVDVEIWLFGTPVQQINQHCINSTRFRKVYAIHSTKDWLQRMDPQGLRDKKSRKNHFWSDRIFDPTSSCIQATLTVNNQPICHSYYRYILKHFPTMQQQIEEQSKELGSGMIAVNLEI